MITVYFSKHNDVQYVFVGCRPDSFNTMKAVQSADSSNITRQVTFLYDGMFVSSQLEQIERATSKLFGVVGGLLGGAGKMLKI